MLLSEHGQGPPLVVALALWSVPAIGVTLSLAHIVASWFVFATVLVVGVGLAVLPVLFVLQPQRGHARVQARPQGLLIRAVAGSVPAEGLVPWREFTRARLGRTGLVLHRGDESRLVFAGPELGALVSDVVERGIVVDGRP